MMEVIIRQAQTIAIIFIRNAFQTKTFRKVGVLHLFSAIKKQRKPCVHVFTYLKRMGNLYMIAFKYLLFRFNLRIIPYNTNPGRVPSCLLLNFLKGIAYKYVLHIY